MSPRVSICVPNLNTRPFLPDRFQTIFEQSYQDWELLVYDSYSNDGAWEYIRELAAGEPRMRIWQGPREGTPASWNPCIHEARGEFVYVATSDDTMAPDCLAKLVEALEAQPECDVAHCRLRAIDEDGQEVPAISEWWSQNSLFALSSGPLFHRRHLRKAPFDGLLHLRGESVYISITQLLIRRSLFARIGLFESTWGSVGDFNWGMRAGLVANVVHVPDTWGGWRVHGSQATASAELGSAEHACKIERMIEHAIESCGDLLAPELRQKLDSRWSAFAKDFRTFERVVLGSSSGRRGLMLRRLLAGSGAAREHLKSSLLGLRPWQHVFPDWVRLWLEEVGAETISLPATKLRDPAK